MEANNIAKEHWDKMAEEPPATGTQWVHSKKVLAEINRRVSGDPNVDFMGYCLQNNFLIPNPPETFSVLSLACGSGMLERQLASTGKFHLIDGIDISEGSIEIAQRDALAEGFKFLSYRAANLNQVQLEPQKYDLVLSVSAMHHIKNLDHILTQIQRSLKPGGVLVLYDFVGPSQFQWTDLQLVLMNFMLDLLPPRLRNDLLNPGQPKPPLERATIEQMNNADPSEAIRSKEIIPKIKKYFNILNQKDWGGTILHLGLQNIIGNFNEDDPSDFALLSRIISTEEEMIRKGIIESDFTFLVASPKSKNE